jgi:hypothetical protein
MATSFAVSTDAEEALVVRVWAGDDGSIHARLTTQDLTTVTVGRDRTLAAIAAWLDALTADIH